MCVGGVDLARQNGITQQILTQYLQKRLNRAGGSNVQVGHQQLLTSNELPAAGAGNNGFQKNDAENLYAEEDDAEDAQYSQG